MMNESHWWIRTLAAAFMIGTSLTVAALAASIAAFALVFLCMPLIMGADMPNSRWLEAVATAIVIAGSVAAFIVSFRESMQEWQIANDRFPPIPVISLQPSA